MHLTSEQLKADLKKWQTPALGAGVVGLAATAGAFVLMKGSAETVTLFWEVYLMAFLVVAALTFGSIGMLMMGHLATSRWLHFLQRPCEAAAKNVFYVAILAVGLWFGRTHLYQEWINRGHDGNVAQREVPFNPADAIKVIGGHAVVEEHAAGEEHAGHPVEQFNAMKHAYMTDTMWTLRGGAVLAVFAIMAVLLTRWSRQQQDTKGGEPYGIYQRRLSGPGIIIIALAATVLAFDLLVAIDRKWFSSIYGAITFVSFILTTTAFMAMFMCKVRDYEPYKSKMTNRHSHDIGTFMFAFTVLWTYMNAGQLVIIWNGNMIEETSFFFRRIDGAWPVVDWVLFLCAFIIPFFLLLNQPLKQNKKTLAMIGAWVFVFRYLDWYWEITPWFHGTPAFHWVMITAPIGMVGIWFFLFLRNFVANPLPVSTDVRFKAMLYDESAHEAHH